MSNRGFSILEVLLAMAIFMAGMLGVVALQISSTKGATFSGNLSEASFHASNKLEELMEASYGDDRLDDDDPANSLAGLDDTCANADGCDQLVGRNGNFTVYWNVAVDEPISNCKTIRVFCEWAVKSQTHKVEFNGIRSKTN
ncbi:MAG: prepilin-type N-terminal cleavage/methylation domain-containing protein [Desulfobulbaceae bacterium]|nr:prepilin-type N-terminal cleavage/methylation domain-containing protein [Desulfobulbaceae bacterium]